MDIEYPCGCKYNIYAALSIDMYAGDRGHIESSVGKLCKEHAEELKQDTKIGLQERSKRQYEQLGKLLDKVPLDR